MTGRHAAADDRTENEPASSESISRVARGSAANLVGAAVTGICTFAVTVVVARGFAKSDAGVFFATTSLFLVATTIGQLGTQTGLVYFLARCRARGTLHLVGPYLRAAVRPMVALAIAMAIAMVVLAPWLARTITSEDADRAATYLRWIAIFIPFAGIEIVLLAGTRGLGAIRPYALIEQIGRPVLQLAIVAAAAIGGFAPMLGLAWAIAYAPAAVAALVAWQRIRSRRLRSTLAEPGAPESVAGEFWKFTLPRSLTSTIQMLMQRFDVVLVAALAGTVDAAIYAAATRFIVLGQLGINALTIAAQPRFAATLSTDDHRGASELYRVTTAWLIIVTWPVYLALLVFARPILTVFGHGYSAGGTAIALIAASMLVGTGTGMVDTALAMSGHTLWNLGNALLALAVNLGLDFWLIPTHGIVGAAIGWAAAIAVRNISALVQVALSMRLHPIAQPTMVAAGLSVACYAALAWLARLLFGDRVPVMLATLAVVTVGYVAGLVAFRRALRLSALTGLRRGRVAGES